MSWADDYTINGLPAGYCGSGLSEDWNDYGSEGYAYKTVIKTTCDWINTEYTVYMTEADWYNLEFFYSAWDTQGNLTKDSIIKECHTHRTNTDWMGCTFIVGVVDADEYGVTNSLQQTAGWLNGVYD